MGKNTLSNSRISPLSYSLLSSSCVFLGGARPCQPEEDAEPCCRMENSSERTASPSRKVRSHSRCILPSESGPSRFSLPPLGLFDPRPLFLPLFFTGLGATGDLATSMAPGITWSRLFAGVTGLTSAGLFPGCGSFPRGRAEKLSQFSQGRRKWDALTSTTHLHSPPTHTDASASQFGEQGARVR